jgi:hypothetical protein
MSDLVTTGAVVVAGLTAKDLAVGGLKQVQDFIAAVSGNKGESIGTLLGNIARRRLNNAESVAGKAHFILLNIGVPAKQLSDSVLQPILESASLQDDEFFQTRWAYLLSNAADSRNKHPFEVCFVGMLRNLSAREVRFLDGLFSDKRQFALNARRFHIIYREAGLARNSQPPNMPHYSTVPILDDADEREYELMMDILKRETILSDNAEGKSGDSRFTRLGFAFVQACQKPAGDAGALAGA